MTSYRVRCRTAAGEDVLVSVDATSPEDAINILEEHIALFYGPGDPAGRWLASKNPDSIVKAHEVVE